MLTLVLALLGSAACAADGPVSAHRHMVATANPLATHAALSVLRDGGSAADAAIAAQMMLAVVEPQSSGLGGGSLLLVFDRAERSIGFYEGLASAPAALPDDWSHDGGTDIVELKRSGRLVGVPGTLRMLALLHARHGHLPWARLFSDAISTAEAGFAMPPYLHSTLRGLPLLSGIADFAAYFGPDYMPLPVGTVIRNPALASTLRLVAAGGADAFYQGTLADQIVAAVDSPPHAGVMRPGDLAAYRAHNLDPVCAAAFGRTICSAAPPSSGGISVLQQVALLDRLHIGATAPGSAAAAHLMLEASRLAAADRRAYANVRDEATVQGLIDPAYLDARARLVQPGRALDRATPGDPPPQHASLPEAEPLTAPATTHVSVVDDAGNAVSFTTTINLNFGAALVVDGIVLNDSITNFSRTNNPAGPLPANAGAPGRRPASTMAPTIVLGSDGPELIVGAGGGARIPDAVAETIVGVLAWHMDVRCAIEQPRLGGQNRDEELERGTPAAGLETELRAMGHRPFVVGMNAGVQAIGVGPGGLTGWADAHRDGTADGD